MPAAIKHLPTHRAIGRMPDTTAQQVNHCSLRLRFRVGTRCDGFNLQSVEWFDAATLRVIARENDALARGCTGMNHKVDRSDLSLSMRLLAQSAKTKLWYPF